MPAASAQHATRAYILPVLQARTFATPSTDCMPDHRDTAAPCAVIHCCLVCTYLPTWKAHLRVPAAACLKRSGAAYLEGLAAAHMTEPHAAYLKGLRRPGPVLSVRAACCLSGMVGLSLTYGQLLPF